jgi:hypothetical protein
MKDFSKVDTKRFVRIAGLTSSKTYRKLEIHSEKNHISISQLVAIALDQQFDKDYPFTLEISLPDDDFVDYAYADEAGKIMSFLDDTEVGSTLEVLYLLRHEMGIESRGRFLGGFKELLAKGVLDCYTPKKTMLRKHAEFQEYYRLVKNVPKTRKPKQTRQQKELATLAKLQKKYPVGGKHDV